MPPMMVAPEREVPGISAKHCAKPTFSASSQRHGLRAFHPRRALASVDQQNDDAADDEGERDRDRLEEMGLDEARRPASPSTAAGMKATTRLRHSCEIDPEEPRAVFPQHGEHRAGLDRDVEHVAARVIEAEQVAGEDQVAGARDRQELGEPLDDAEDERVKEVVHSRNSLMLGQ